MSSPKTSLRPIHGPSAVLLYNWTHKKFISTPALRLKTTGAGLSTAGGGLEAYPRLTANASEAGVILMGTISLTGHDLLQSKPILMRMNTGMVGTRIYLGVNPTDPLTGTGFSDGQAVLYQEAKDLRLVQWQVKPAWLSGDQHLFDSYAGADIGPNIYYGVPYIITNAHYLTNLQINMANKTDLVASLDYQDVPETWVFLPTSPIYTCETSVNLCSTTRGTENGFTPFLCDPTTGMCHNQYRELVTFHEGECDRLCGTASLSSAGLGKTSEPKEETSQPRESKISADITGVLIFVIVVLFVIVGAWFWRKNQQDAVPI